MEGIWDGIHQPVRVLATMEVLDLKEEEILFHATALPGGIEIAHITPYTVMVPEEIPPGLSRRKMTPTMNLVLTIFWIQVKNANLIPIRQAQACGLALSELTNHLAI